MKMTKVLVAFSMLSFGLLGCGGIDAAEESAQEDTFESVSQGLCGPIPPTGGCEPDSMTATPENQTCNHFGFAFTFTCEQAVGSSCLLWRCTSGGYWTSKAIGMTCPQATAGYCS